MGNLTKNLSRSEFECECGCGFDTVDFVLINSLQACANFFSDRLGVRVVLSITGGNRCVRHNTSLRDLYRATNGLEGANTSLQSQHIHGRAADFKVFYRDGSMDLIQIEADDVATWIVNNYPELSVGRYKNRTHIDTRSSSPAYWDVRS